MSKKPGKKEDTISQLKKEEKIKKNNKKDEDESASEEEEEQNDNDIKEQTIQKSDKPKNLKDLLSSMEQKPKAKPKKPQQKQKNNDEPVKHIFINSKGTANADTKIVPNKENDKKNYTYTEKEVKKAYNEDVAKPTFTSGKDGENFVELNKNEDVSDKIYFII